MSIFIVTAVLSAGVIYGFHSDVVEINNSTQANILNTTYKTQKVSVRILSGSEVETYKVRLNNQKSSETIYNILKNLEKNNYISIETIIKTGRMEIKDINSKNNILNGKSWNVYINNRKITTPIDDYKINGGDEVTFAYE